MHVGLLITPPIGDRARRQHRRHPPKQQASSLRSVAPAVRSADPVDHPGRPRWRHCYVQRLVQIRQMPLQRGPARWQVRDKELDDALYLFRPSPPPYAQEQARLALRPRSMRRRHQRTLSAAEAAHGREAFRAIAPDHLDRFRTSVVRHREATPDREQCGQTFVGTRPHPLQTIVRYRFRPFGYCRRSYEVPLEAGRSTRDGVDARWRHRHQSR